MPHNVTALNVTNFRSCKSVEVMLGPFVPLVGYNNAGKSNILAALEWLFKERVLPISEFTDPTKPVVVEGVIVDVNDDVIGRLAPDHQVRIKEFIKDGAIRIRRTQPPTATKKTEITLSVCDPATNEYRVNPGGIWNAIKALFPEPIRIGAMENAADDVSKAKSTSTIGKLLAEFGAAVKNNHAMKVERHLKAIGRLMKADGSRRLPELDEIDAAINTKIEDLFPGLSLKLHFEVPSFEEIFSSGTVKIFEELGTPRDFSAYGHGAQRAIQMALIRHLADIKQSTKSPTTTLLLIDEPELYLHPFAIEQVREALISLSMHGYQVVFSTHSAQMITSDRAQHAVLVRKMDARGTHVRKRLKDALEKVVPDARAQAEHLFSLSQSTHVLFANQVVITEGKTELRLLPTLYRVTHGKTFGQDQTAMIEVGSADSIAKTLQILREMDLPARAVVDLDYAFRGAVQAQMLRADDDSLVALKKIFKRLEDEKRCRLSPDNGLPTGKNSPLSAAKAFELLAQEPDAAMHIGLLHTKLLANDVWLWTKGAVESHLGLSAKNEAVWANFKSELEAKGVDACCIDAANVKALLTWLNSPRIEVKIPDANVLALSNAETRFNEMQLVGA